MDEIFFHYGNNFLNSLIDGKGRPWTTRCKTGGNYKGTPVKVEGPVSNKKVNE